VEPLARPRSLPQATPTDADKAAERNPFFRSAYDDTIRSIQSGRPLKCVAAAGSLGMPLLTLCCCCRQRASACWNRSKPPVPALQGRTVLAVGRRRGGRVRALRRADRRASRLQLSLAPPSLLALCRPGRWNLAGPPPRLHWIPHCPGCRHRLFLTCRRRLHLPRSDQTLQPEDPRPGRRHGGPVLGRQRPLLPGGGQPAARPAALPHRWGLLASIRQPAFGLSSCWDRRLPGCRHQPDPESPGPT
jgi:hypothetical protein